jgi:single-strand DNA-binding protein
MNTLINNVQLIGNLGKNVELKKFDSGNKKASFSLATTESFKNTKGEFVKNTQWHNIVAWGKNAELISKALEKGSKVAIQGTINYRSYLDKEGQTKYITEILVSDFMKMTAEAKSNVTPEKDPKPF